MYPGLSHVSKIREKDQFSRVHCKTRGSGFETSLVHTNLVDIIHTNPGRKQSINLSPLIYLINNLCLLPTSVQQYSLHPASNVHSRWTSWTASFTAGTRLSGQPRECPTTPGPVSRSRSQEECHPSSISTVVSLSVY